MIGQTLRHYRIEAKLGEGGMGVVYRAVDTHLDRTVAIKVLPASALADADRKARFVQEAKAASALNHPNIITIHDIDSADGVDFIAMEYVPGKTLDRLAGRRGLKFQEALKYGIQIADALSAAHAAGIIHRDLKPANVMVTEQGLVKVLDFGLAKLSDPAEPDAFALTGSMHVEDRPRSEIGTIVGTAAYMSPEQAEGKKVDARSDIFSFGTVLYEMLAGKRAFAGDSKLSILTAVLHKDPPPLGAVEGVPRDLEKTIARCLRKEPQRRWQTVADLKIALEETLDESERGEAALGQAASARARRGIKGWLWPVLVGLLLGAGVAAYVAQRLIQPTPPSFHRLTFRRGDITSAKFAPDGQTIVYTAAWDGNPAQIFSTRIGGRESRPLGLPEGKLLSVSPSGELAILVGNFASAYDKGTLARVPLAGGAPREILEDVADADWSPDGTTLAVVRVVAGKNRVEFPVGKVLYESEGRPPMALRVSPK